MKQNVAVFFGGRSTEHDVSIITGLVGVIGPLKLTEQYNPIPVYIAKNGSWYSEQDLADIHFYRTGSIDDKLQKFKKVQLLFDNGLWLVKGGLRSAKIRIDIAFPAMHGTYGEDGSLMGVLRMADIPFVGSDIIASAVAMDKLICRYVTEAAGVLNPKFVGFSAHEYENDRPQINKRIGALRYPLFVKPTHLGSSIAVSKVEKKQDLDNAIEVALYYDNAVLVEEAVENLIEVTVPIVGNNTYETAMVEEILNKGDTFFDFQAKYLHGGKKIGGAKNSGGQGGGKYSRMPAELPADLYRKCEDIVRQVFKIIGGTGYARIDLLIDKATQKVYFNEINPLPGTLQRHNWKEKGVSPVQLVEKLIALAVERHEHAKKQIYTFNSSFLQQFQ